MTPQVRENLKKVRVKEKDMDVASNLKAMLMVTNAIAFPDRQVPVTYNIAGQDIFNSVAHYIPGKNGHEHYRVNVRGAGKRVQELRKKGFYFERNRNGWSMHPERSQDEIDMSSVLWGVAINRVRRRLQENGTFMFQYGESVGHTSFLSSIIEWTEVFFDAQREALEEKCLSEKYISSTLSPEAFDAKVVEIYFVNLLQINKVSKKLVKRVLSLSPSMN